MRFLLASPWLIAGDICREIGFAIYGRRLRDV